LETEGQTVASKTIKGLTVEIGGDTTKLGKAIKDVEAKSRSLSKELGDINKLLKMDPGNTDLLAQKQKVLADAVEATAKKLDTLKEAEKQVQQQFERGEVSEEQLRALQREIVATENKSQLLFFLSILKNSSQTDLGSEHNAIIKSLKDCLQTSSSSFSNIKIFIKSFMYLSASNLSSFAEEKETTF
jgi:phage-related minor tail protein